MSSVAMPSRTDRQTISAALLGSSQSSVMQEISKVMAVSSPGAEGVESADLVVIDGETISPNDFAESSPFAKALRAGKWMLVLNARQAHKAEGIAKLVGAGTIGDSKAYLVRDWGRGAIVIDVAPLPPPAESKLAKVAHYYGKSSSTIAAEVQAHLTDKRWADLAAAQDQVPNGLIFKQYYYPLSRDFDLGVPPHSSSGQQSSITAMATVTLYLDNRDNPQGTFQWLSCQLDGMASVTADGRPIANDGERVKGWIQSLVQIAVDPAEAPLDWYSLSPSTTNLQTTYSTGTSFNVGFSPSSGVSGTYTVTNGESHTIPDWGVLRQGTPDSGQWVFTSMSPGNGLAQDYADCHAGWMHTCTMQSGLPKDPNNICKSSMEFHIEKVWKSSTVLDAQYYLATSLVQRMVALWCERYSTGACFGAESWRFQDTTLSTGLLVDFGVVLPVPIKSLDFTPRVAKAGETVTGTITLASAAKTAVTIGLQSNSQNATVLPTVQIQAGETSASFQLLTNGNGIGSGGKVVATITAFYGGNFQAQLTVED